MEIKQRRFQFLHKLYELSKENPNRILPIDTIQEPTADSNAIVQYLVNEGLITNRDYWITRGGGASTGISITHNGIKEVEQALSKPEKPTEHFPANVINNVINVVGDMKGNIQQGSPGAKQTVTEGSTKDNNEKKIRMLFVSANPKNTHLLELIKECNNVRDRIAFGEYGDQFNFDQRHDVSVSEMDTHLLDYKPQILHFSGHGSSEGIIIFQDSDKEAEGTSIKALSDLFRIVNSDNTVTEENRIKLVFLNACYSQKQAKAISKYVDCVVGMSTAVTDEAARVFAESFYQAIGYGRSVKTAFELGCNKVVRLNIPEEHTPKLLHRPEVDPASLYFTKQK